MSNKLEKQVRDPAVAHAKRHLRVIHKRMHFGYGAASGWPDDLFVFADGHHWWVEFKREGGTPSSLQEHAHAALREFHGDVSVIDSAAQFRTEFALRLAAHGR